MTLAWRLHRSTATDRVAANRLFAFSIFYLFALFAALAASNGNRLSDPPFPRAAPTAAAAEFLPHVAQAAGYSKSISADEA